MIKFYFFLITSLFIVQSKEAFGQSREFEILKNLELIDQVHEHLELYFVDEPQTGKISKVAIDAMLKELDPSNNWCRWWCEIDDGVGFLNPSTCLSPTPRSPN